ncbi:helix-turn-helix domain-containing protein [Pedobacter sp. N36a]|uniref:AraC family transcriptional regulator n=1 Tax=Pedobacter sp. N36a TaxID=2767996 RepID=UPI00165731CD|nr:AraC family transcriptional regulator [Pedobacter sp. N36a]MBC8988445.1 helix-turn-helix domain-containing protein [Pedobacter sp. N36a]
MKTIKFHKTECGVDFLLNVLTEKDIDYTDTGTFDTDYFEILFFKEAKGILILNQQEIELKAGSIIFISPFQKRNWRLEPNNLQVTTLIFQEAFLNDFFADKLFTYRLLYFYQLVHPLKLDIDKDEMLKYCSLLTEIKIELLASETDSVHIIRSLLYYLLQTLNRRYAKQHDLSLNKSGNNLAFHFKNLLEIHIKEKQRINDYAEMLGISRISLNKAVKAQFNTTATQLLKQRLLFEIQNLLLHSNKTINEIAYELNFSEPNHLMRFFKTQTGQTTTEFINSMTNIPRKAETNPYQKGIL